MDVDYWGAVLAFLRVASFKLVLKREQARFMKGRDIEVIIRKVLECQKQRRLEEERKRQEASIQWTLYSEADAEEGTFSPPPLSRSDIPPNLKILILESADDSEQLRVEREMVHHREMENLTVRLLNERRGSQRIDDATGWNVETTVAYFSFIVCDKQI